jgi:hypothetical protein
MEACKGRNGRVSGRWARLGGAAFAFFLVKGLVWLALVGGGAAVALR